MFDGKIIEKLLRDRGMKKKELLDAVGWTSQSQLVQFIEGNPTAQSLEKVADVFGCSIDVFFKREIADYENCIFYGADRAMLEERLISMQRLLEAKDSHIKDLEKILRIYEDDTDNEKEI